jgi:hypothetical protein
MGRCRLCEQRSEKIAAELGLCRSCLLDKPDQALPLALEAHRRSRACFGLPGTAPKDPRGVPCRLCVHECRIPEGGTGYCGLRRNEGAEFGTSPAKRANFPGITIPCPHICLTAACDEIPPPLLNQLRSGGKLIAPVRERDVQNLVLVEKTPKGTTRKVICTVLYVSLQGRYGAR